MPNLNRVSIEGHLGKDVELRYTAGGSPVASFSVAATDKWKDNQGEKKESTTWFNVVVWGSQAEQCKDSLVKGNAVHVEGKLKNRSWEDKDGNKKYITEVTADSVFLWVGNIDSTHTENLPRESEPANEDLPF